MSCTGQTPLVSPGRTLSTQTAGYSSAAVVPPAITRGHGRRPCCAAICGSAVLPPQRGFDLVPRRFVDPAHRPPRPRPLATATRKERVRRAVAQLSTAVLAYHGIRIVQPPDALPLDPGVHPRGDLPQVHPSVAGAAARLRHSGDSRGRPGLSRRDRFYGHDWYRSRRGSWWGRVRPSGHGATAGSRGRSPGPSAGRSGWRPGRGARRCSGGFRVAWGRGPGRAGPRLR